jgi:alpha/beta hydrolase fold
MKAKAAVVVAWLCLLAGGTQAQKVIRLYPGPAPGSETWTHQEKEYFSPIFNTQVVTNVAQPTLTAYLPEQAAAGGTAVIVCPGGGFHVLSINSEGVDVAKWLNAKGVAAFVLRYRLVPTGEDGAKELMAKIGNRTKLNADNAAVVPLAVADGLAAVSYVRKHAAEFGVSPQRIGLMGFSAGGTVTASLAFQYTAESRPDSSPPFTLTWARSRPRRCRRTRRRSSSSPRRTISSGWRRTASTSTASGSGRRSLSNCTSIQKAGMGSACGNRICRPTSGSSDSATGSRCKVCSNRRSDLAPGRKLPTSQAGRASAAAVRHGIT